VNRLATLCCFYITLSYSSYIEDMHLENHSLNEMNWYKDSKWRYEVFQEEIDKRKDVIQQVESVTVRPICSGCAVAGV
jgi:hypothetical protein